MASRIENIEKYARKQDEIKAEAAGRQKNRIDILTKQILSLKPRIDELIATGNACVKNGIPLKGRGFGCHEGYDTHQFYTNSLSHLVGFVHSKEEPITKLGIFAGGACGDWDFYTDGVEVYEQCKDKRRESLPNIT